MTLVLLTLLDNWRIGLSQNNSFNKHKIIYICYNVYEHYNVYAHTHGLK